MMPTVKADDKQEKFGVAFNNTWIVRPKFNKADAQIMVDYLKATQQSFFDRYPNVTAQDYHDLSDACTYIRVRKNRISFRSGVDVQADLSDADILKQFYANRNRIKSKTLFKHAFPYASQSVIEEVRLLLQHDRRFPAIFERPYLEIVNGQSIEHVDRLPALLVGAFAICPTEVGGWLNFKHLRMFHILTRFYLLIPLGFSLDRAMQLADALNQIDGVSTMQTRDKAIIDQSKKIYAEFTGISFDD